MGTTELIRTDKCGHLRASVFLSVLTDFVRGGKSTVVFLKLIWNATLLWDTRLMLQNRHCMPCCPKPHFQIYFYEVFCLSSHILCSPVVRVSPSLHPLNVLVHNPVFLPLLWDCYCHRSDQPATCVLMRCTEKHLERTGPRTEPCSVPLNREDTHCSSVE